jgi:hypothetical protein
LILAASYAATAIAFLVIGIAIGRKRDAKVRNEIARVGDMVRAEMRAGRALTKLAEMSTSVRHRGASVEQAEHAKQSVSASYDVDKNVATVEGRS